MATDIGKVGLVTKGTWNNSATYEVLDIVTYQNALYIAKQAVPAGTLPTNTSYWQVAIDASAKADKVIGGAVNRVVTLTSDGNIADSGKTIANLLGLWASGSLLTDVDFDDLDTGLYIVTPGTSTHVPPVSETAWFVLTIGGYISSTNFKIQIAVGVTVTNLYIRRCYGSWGSWAKITATT